MVEIYDDWTEIELDDETISLAIKHGDIRVATVLGTPMAIDHYDDGLPSYSATTEAGLERLLDAVRMSKL